MHDLHLRVDRMSQKTIRGTRVLVLCMLNQPATRVESTCIHMLIECPKYNTGALMLCVEITRAVKRAC